MFAVEEDSIDDLMRGVFEALIGEGQLTHPTQGPAREFVGAALTLTNPRARLSRSDKRSTAVSALGELLWYLSGSDDAKHAGYYIPLYLNVEVNGRVEGAYGPRLFGDREQFRRVLDLLGTKTDSRRAIVQIYDERDMDNVHDVPCTCTLQFLLRDGRLDLVVYMRSNDAYLGLPHDVFCFTMLQELAAVHLGAELGIYRHFAGSLHLYERDVEAAKAFIGEGWLVKKSMPRIPDGDPWPAVEAIVALESRIRGGGRVETQDLPAGYWGDLTRLLVAYRRHRDGESVGEMLPANDPYFDIYLTDRLFREGEAK